MQQGPEVELKLSCRGCGHLQSTCEVDEQGDRDWTYSCGHIKTYLGHTPRPPSTCPFRAEAIAAKVKSLGF